MMNYSEVEDMKTQLYWAIKRFHSVLLSIIKNTIMLNSLNENACHFSRLFRIATKLGIVIICLPFWIKDGIDNEKDEQSLKVIFYVLCNVNETSSTLNGLQTFYQP